MTDPTTPPAPAPAEPTAAPHVSVPTPRRERQPLPALGLVLGAAWVLICSASRTYPQVVGYPGQMPFLVGTNALGALLLVMVPLLLRQIPADLQRQAMPFLVLAGLSAVGAGLVGGTRGGVVLLVNASVLYVIGSLRLRGRDPRLALLALATPVLYGLGAVACALIATQPSRRIPVSPASGLWTSLALVAAVLLGVLPVCVPVLVASWLSRRQPSELAVDETSENGAVTPAPALNSFAMASLVLGITGGSLFAVVFGHVALSQIHRTKQAGSRLATAGLVLGYLGILAAAAVGLMGSMVVGFLLLTVGG